MNLRRSARCSPILVALTCLLILSGCAGAALSPPAASETGGSIASPSGVAPSPTGTTTPAAQLPGSPAGKVIWTYDGQRPAAQFEEVAAVLVGYTLERKRLRMTALDPMDGSVLWDRAASPGFVPPGVAPQLTTIGDHVVLLAPSDSDRAGHFWVTVTIVAARTGRIVAASDGRYWVDGLPERCGERICFEGYAGDATEDDDHRQFAMDPRTGNVRAKGDAGQTDEDWRSIGTGGLVHVDTDDGGAIGRVVGGKLLWKQPYADVFAEDFSADGGWSFHYDKKNGLFTGEVGWFPGTPKPIRENLRQRAMMVGLDAATGTVRWREQGVSRNCSPVSDVISMIGDEEDYRCRYRSGYRDPEKGADHLLENVGVSIQRFDHRTGKTVWEVDTDAYTADSWQAWSRQVTLFDDNAVLARQDDAPVVINIATGKVAAAGPDAVGWHATSQELPYAIRYYGADSEIRFRASGTLVEPWRGSRPASTISTLPPASIAGDFGALRVVTGTRAVTGVRPR